MKIQEKQAQRSVYPLSSLFDTVDSLSYRYPSGASKFLMSEPLNRLKLAMASLYALFRLIHQKFACAKSVEAMSSDPNFLDYLFNLVDA